MAGTIKTFPIGRTGSLRRVYDTDVVSRDSGAPANDGTFTGGDGWIAFNPPNACPSTMSLIPYVPGASVAGAGTVTVWGLDRTHGGLYVAKMLLQFSFTSSGNANANITTDNGVMSAADAITLVQGNANVDSVIISPGAAAGVGQVMFSLKGCRGLYIELQDTNGAGINVLARPS
jgi:hypothetical protein